MRSIKDLKAELDRVNRELKSVISASKYHYYDDLSGLECDTSDPEQLFIREELKSVMYELDKVSYNLSYLNQPIAHEGILYKLDNGRYACDGCELSSGYGLEVLVYDEYEGRYIWVATRVEHNGDDYYLVGMRETPLAGTKARIRERISNGGY